MFHLKAAIKIDSPIKHNSPKFSFITKKSLTVLLEFVFLSRFIIKEHSRYDIKYTNKTFKRLIKQTTWEQQKVGCGREKGIYGSQMLRVVSHWPSLSGLGRQSQMLGHVQTAHVRANIQTIYRPTTNTGIHTLNT